MQEAWGGKGALGWFALEAAGLWAFGSDRPGPCRLSARGCSQTGRRAWPYLLPGSEGDVKSPGAPGGSWGWRTKDTGCCVGRIVLSVKIRLTSGLELLGATELSRGPQPGSRCVCRPGSPSFFPPLAAGGVDRGPVDRGGQPRAPSGGWAGGGASGQREGHIWRNAVLPLKGVTVGARAAVGQD